MDRWTEFYAPHFASEEDAAGFVSRCEATTPPNHQAKVMMHQVRRLVSIADEMPKIRPARESLQIFFLIVCAENIAKVADGYNQDGMSGRYVRKFFVDNISAADQDRLESSFFDLDGNPLALGDVISLLYKVRCDVAHEGNYWEFAFSDGKMDMVNARQSVEVRMTYSEFYDVVVRTAVSAIESFLAKTP